MTVIILERMPQSLRGELTRWMVEAKTGVYVGKLSARVRERLWERCRHAAGQHPRGSAYCLWRTNTPQGFSMAAANPRGRYAEEVDGVWLVRTA